MLVPQFVQNVSLGETGEPQLGQKFAVVGGGWSGWILSIVGALEDGPVDDRSVSGVDGCWPLLRMNRAERAIVADTPMRITAITR